MPEITGYEVEREEVHAGDPPFLRLCRLHLRNRRSDGSRSQPYVCDYVDRPGRPDAVVVAVFSRREDGCHVLLRECLRPALGVGRATVDPPIPDAAPYLLFSEVVAGVIEPEDRGEAGIRARAAVEVAEEAGYRVDPAQVFFLGAGMFPSPGSMIEKFWFVAAEVGDPSGATPPPGDGSPMEEGARLRWLPLDRAISACVQGEIEDAKTELVLRRLRDHLQYA